MMFKKQTETVSNTFFLSIKNISAKKGLTLFTSVLDFRILPLLPCPVTVITGVLVEFHIVPQLVMSNQCTQAEMKT